MSGAECLTDHRLLRAQLSAIVKRQIRKASVRPPRRIDVSQRACEEKLECFHKAVEAIDLTKSTDPWELLAAKDSWWLARFRILLINVIPSRCIINYALSMAPHVLSLLQ